MNRDGAQTSLWQNKMPAYVPVNKSGNLKFDVVIAGGGITGITTALLLAKEGKSVAVLEAHNLCFGTTGGTTSHLNTFFDTSYDYIKSDFGEDAVQLAAHGASRALELFRTNIETYNIDCEYSVQDGYVYAQDEKQNEQLQKIVDASALGGVDLSYTDRIPVPMEFTKAIVYRDQASIHPSKYVYALAKEFEALGGVIITNCKVGDVVEDEERVVIQTSQNAYEATYLIWATHIPPGINLLHFRCAPYRSYALAVKLKSNGYPDGLAYDMYDPYHYLRTQVIDGEKYLIVGGEDHKTGHQPATEGCFRRLEAYVREHYAVDTIPFRWSSQYYEPSDGIAYIGLLPGSKGNVLVASGFSGNGMTYSHIAAPLLTDLIMKRENALAALYSPNRVKPVAGFTNFVKENADVVKEFVSKRFSYEKIETLSELANGEARLVEYEGKKLAIYKDDNGRLFAVNPVCTHAKCIVDWNTSEKSWDCPCHGARYTAMGEVLNGPARKPLEVIALEELIARD